VTSARLVLLRNVLGYLALICAVGTIVASVVEWRAEVQTLWVSSILWAAAVVLGLVSLAVSLATRPRGEGAQLALAALGVCALIAALIAVVYLRALIGHGGE
jgi:hypothetical protein